MIPDYTGVGIGRFHCNLLAHCTPRDYQLFFVKLNVPIDIQIMLLINKSG